MYTFKILNTFIVHALSPGNEKLSETILTLEQVSVLIGDTDADKCRGLWLCRRMGENIASGRQISWTISCPWRGWGEKRAFQEEATAREISILIPHRCQGQPTRLIWFSMAVAQQRAEFGTTMTSLAFFLGYPGLSAWSCLTFIEAYLWEHPYQAMSKAQA